MTEMSTSACAERLELRVPQDFRVLHVSVAAPAAFSARVFEKREPVPVLEVAPEMRLRPARVFVVGLGHVRDEVCVFGHLEERERVPSPPYSSSASRAPV